MASRLSLEVRGRFVAVLLSVATGAAPMLRAQDGSSGFDLSGLLEQLAFGGLGPIADQAAERRVIKSLIQAGRLGDAVERARAYADGQPGDRAARQVLAYALALSGDWSAAEAEMQRAVELGEPEAGLLCQLGGIQLGAGRVDDARESFQQAATLNPDEASVLLGLALIAERDQPLEAERLYRDYLERTPSAAPAVRMNLARLYQARGEHARSIALWQQALQAGPETPVLHTALANAYLKSGRAAEGVAHLQQSLRLAAGSDEALLGLAAACRNLGQPAEARAALQAISDRDTVAVLVEEAELALADADAAAALRYFRRAAEIDPHAWHPRSRLVVVALTHRQPEAALGAAQELRKIDTPLPELDRVGAALEAHHLFAEALATYEVAANRFPEEPAPHYRLALLNAAMGRPAPAVAALTRLLELRPRHPAALKLLALIHSRERNWALAADAARGFVETKAGNVDDRLWAAGILERAGCFAEAALVYRAVLRESEEHVVALNNLASVLTALGEGAKAVALARRAVAATEATNPDCLDTLGWALLATGDAEAAVVELQRALGLRPADPTLRYHLAVAQERCQRFDQALREIERALAGNVDFEARAEAIAVRDRLQAASATPRAMP